MVQLLTASVQKNTRRKEEFLAHIENLMKKLPEYAPVDAAVDQKAREFFHDCLPPVPTPGMSHWRKLAETGQFYYVVTIYVTTLRRTGHQRPRSSS